MCPRCLLVWWQVPNGSEVRAWVGLGVSIVSLYYLGKYAGASIRALQDGSQNETATANRARLVAALEARGKTPEEARRIAATAPNKYEATILQEVVFPEQLASTFAEVGGLERMKEELYESIILPLREPELFKVRANHSAQGRLARGMYFVFPCSPRCSSFRCCSLPVCA